MIDSCNSYKNIIKSLQMGQREVNGMVCNSRCVFFATHLYHNFGITKVMYIIIFPLNNLI